MGRIKILILCLLASFAASAQFPPGYTGINTRYDWLAGKFRAVHIPAGTTPALTTGQFTGAGALYVDSVNHIFYFYSGGAWRRANIDTSGQFITSLYRKTASDSVFYVKGGVATFAFKDSIGASGNFVDSLRRVGVNVQAQKSGVWTTQYTDSVGGGSVYVDSVFINGSDDSLIVLKNGFRYASLLPSGGGSSIANYANVYVDSATGNNGTGVVGDPSKPYLTINAALDATTAYPQIIINIGLGTYDSITSSKLRASMWLKGSRQPMPNWNDTSYSLTSVHRTRPTKLIRGTIINGGIQGRDLVQINNVQISDLGFDRGKDWISGGHSKGDNIDLRLSTTGNNANTPPHPLAQNIHIWNVTCLGDTATDAYHSLTIENAENPIVENVLLIYNTHGLAVKTQGGYYNNITSFSHSSTGIIFKANNYAPGARMILDGYYVSSVLHNVTDGYGVMFQNELSGDADPQQGKYIISNGTIDNVIVGMGTNSSTDDFNDIDIHDAIISNTTGSAMDFRLINKSTFSNILINNSAGNAVDIRQGSIGENRLTNIQTYNTTYAGAYIETNSKPIYIHNSSFRKSAVGGKGISVVGGLGYLYLYSSLVDSNYYGMSGKGFTDGNTIIQNSTNTTNGQFENAGDSITRIPDLSLAGSGDYYMGLTSTGKPFRTAVAVGSGGGGGSTIVSDSAWTHYQLNTVPTGIRKFGTANNRSVNMYTNNILRLIMDSVGNFSFNSPATAGYSYKFASYNDDDFFQIGYGNVAESGVKIGSDVNFDSYPRLRLIGYDDTYPLLHLGNGGTESSFKIFAYATPFYGLGDETNNYNSLPFTHKGYHEFQDRTYFGAALGSRATALIDIAAATAAANTGQVKFRNSVLPTTPEVGLMNMKDGLWFIDSSNSVRDTVATREWTSTFVGNDTTHIVTGPTGYYASAYSPRSTFMYEKADRLSFASDSTITPVTTDSTRHWYIPALTVVASGDWLGGNTATQKLVGYTTPNNSKISVYQVSVKVLVTAVGGGGTLTTTCTYTDEGNTSRTVTFYSMGSAVAGMTATGISSYPVLGEIQCYPNTEVSVTTTLTVGTATYNATSSIVFIRNYDQ